MSYSKELYDKIMRNPWLTVYECLRSKCDFSEIGRILKDLLMRPTDTEEYMVGLELLKALKSQAPVEVLLRSISMVVDEGLIKKVLEDTKPEKILEEYRKNYFKGMGLITLLEIFPFLNLRDELAERVKELLRQAPEKIDNEKDLREFLRAITFGPLSVLSPVKLKDVLVFIKDKLSNKPLCLQTKTDIVSMIVDNYPPQILGENTEIIDIIADILREVAENTILLASSELERALNIYSDINIFISKIRKLCEDLGRFDLCRRIWDRAGDSLNELYEKIGKVIVSFNTITEQ
ncbi:hypothetical protein [Staphylothermus hellenicus]|uniref:Uncharacterized protein n=1 Tax=Staphylothermus hellenicus (strain DSM 12710 / JCM 10830 / BK20S6-10-b1 / P8) TaxID=591019 RepID=D7D8F3_STAHD|nr:hypothetical protein [Staphylothermus hellenicus]ADI32049.1 hypothetical protein Shell_0943 [Staphylothermus hellenicus DSM 12710]